MRTMLHGGEIYRGQPIAYDFSVSINPLGIPGEVLRALGETLPLLTRYPDGECRDLRLALAEETGIPRDRILCGNGASELIEASVRALCPHTILLTAPSFSGYRHAAEGAGVQIRYHKLRREENFALTDRFLEDLSQKPDMAILCSPANPVGNLVDPDLLDRIVGMCEQQGTWLLIDECFLGLIEGGQRRSLRNRLREGASRLLVLDAFTKRYAMPGIRLGYLMGPAADAGEVSREKAGPDAGPETGTEADRNTRYRESNRAAPEAVPEGKTVSNPDLSMEGSSDEEFSPVLRRIRAQQPEWSVSVPAQTAGCAALKADKDGDYSLRTRELVKTERRKMEDGLKKLGFRVYPGEANFLFFSTEAEIFRPLLERGILIRDCENYEGLQAGDYRIALRMPEENELLLRTLEEILW